MSDTVTLTIKSSADKKYTISTELSKTVADLKGLIQAESGVESARQRLIYSGRVLKDQDTLESYKIKDGVTIHLVKGADPNATRSPAASSSAAQVPTNLAAGTGAGNMLADLTGARYAGLAQLPSASMFGPDGGMGPPPTQEDLINLMSQPGFGEEMQRVLSNPQIVESLINSNPQMRQMAPQVRQLLQSETFRQGITNPDMMRQMLQMQNAMGGMGGLDAFSQSAFPAPGNPGGASDSSTAAPAGTANSAANSTTNGAAPANPFAGLFGASAGGFDPALLGSMFGGAGAAAPAAPADNRPPEERYEAQLRQLNELGFYDFDRNVTALRRSGGNVQGAIEAMLDGQV